MLQFIRRHSGRRSQLQNERGAALLEFALVSSLLFLVTFGIMSWSYTFFRYNTASLMARDSVRWAALRGDSITAADVQAYVDSKWSGLTATTTWTPDKKVGSRVNVQISAVVPMMIPFFSMTSVTVRSQATMVIVR